MVTTQQLLITKPFWQANAMFMDHKLCVFPESYVMSLNSLNAKLLFDTSIDKSHLKQWNFIDFLKSQIQNFSSFQFYGHIQLHFQYFFYAQRHSQSYSINKP